MNSHGNPTRHRVLSVGKQWTLSLWVLFCTCAFLYIMWLSTLSEK